MFDQDDPGALQAQNEIYRRMTPGQRWAEACKMYDFARAAKTAAIKNDHPDWTAEQVAAAVREIFLYATT
jgi:hypothetical protein